MSQHEVPTGPTIDHSTYIGGTDAAAIVGAHPYKSALDVWAEKRGLVEVRSSDRARVGQVLERPILRHLYAEPNGYTLDFPGTRLSLNNSWQGATPDALVVVRKGRGPYVPSHGVQCKMVGLNQARRWGDVAEGAVPDEVQAQLQWEMGVFQLGFEDVAALIASTDFRVYRVAFDQELYEDLLEAATRFWHDHVLADKPPLVVGTGHDQARHILERHFGAGIGRMAATAEMYDLAQRYDDERKAEKYAADEKKRIGVQLMSLLGQYEQADAPWGSVTWKMQDAVQVPAYERKAQRVLRVNIKEK